MVATTREIDSLECYSVSGGMNGYPTPRIGKFYTGFENFEEAEAFASEHGGEVYSMFRKDGWHVVQPDAYSLKPYNVQAEWYGDDYLIVNSEAEMKREMMWYHDELLEYGSKAELKRLFNQAKRNIRENEGFDWKNKRMVLRNCGEGDLQYYAEIAKHCLSYSHDTKHYMIGVWIR